MVAGARAELPPCWLRTLCVCSSFSALVTSSYVCHAAVVFQGHVHRLLTPAVTPGVLGWCEHE